MFLAINKKLGYRPTFVLKWYHLTGLNRFYMIENAILASDISIITCVYWVGKEYMKHCLSFNPSGFSVLFQKDLESYSVAYTGDLCTPKVHQVYDMVILAGLALSTKWIDTMVFNTHIICGMVTRGQALLLRVQQLVCLQHRVCETIVEISIFTVHLGQRARSIINLHGQYSPRNRNEPYWKDQRLN